MKKKLKAPQQQSIQLLKVLTVLHSSNAINVILASQQHWDKNLLRHHGNNLAAITVGHSKVYYSDKQITCTIFLKDLMKWAKDTLSIDQSGTMMNEWLLKSQAILFLLSLHHKSVPVLHLSKLHNTGRRPCLVSLFSPDQNHRSSSFMNCDVTLM